MTDDLVKRLRKVEPDAPGERTRWHRNPDGPEAADRIEALEKALQKVMVGGNHLACIILPDHPPLETAPLDALEYYGSGNMFDVWCCWKTIMEARAALEGKDD